MREQGTTSAGWSALGTRLPVTVPPLFVKFKGLQVAVYTVQANLLHACKYAILDQTQTHPDISLAAYSLGFGLFWVSYYILRRNSSILPILHLFPVIVED